MQRLLLEGLARESAALVAGALLASLAALLWPVGTAAAIVALVLLALAALLIAGGLVHLIHLARVRRAHPAPGVLVDVGGYRLHVLAEGPRGDHPPVVLFGGGHSAGLSIVHLHRGLREVTRSILVDRPGCGWSDTGPFPRTTVREVDEVLSALRGAGEHGPYVLVGYSFGGLLVANIARRFPEQVATLVLLDATPLETLVLGPRLGAIRTMRRQALLAALGRLVGLHGQWFLDDPARETAMRDLTAALGPQAMADMLAIDCTAGAQLATFSIFRELSAHGIADCAWETVVYDGDLGDLPVVMVAPGSAEEVTAEPEIGGAAPVEAARMIRFYARSRERYLATSSRSRRVVTPPGTTHQFVYETPEFVVRLLREIVTGLRS